MINLRVYPTVADNLLDISWRHSIDNIENVASEFMEQRRLITKKIVLHGPPGTGKTVLAKMIQAKYGLHYINVGSMINSIMENLVSFNTKITCLILNIFCILEKQN